MTNIKGRRRKVILRESGDNAPKRVERLRFLKSLRVDKKSKTFKCLMKV